jgi:hypothetical protein
LIKPYHKYRYATYSEAEIAPIFDFLRRYKLRKEQKESWRKIEHACAVVFRIPEGTIRHFR